MRHVSFACVIAVAELLAGRVDGVMAGATRQELADAIRALEAAHSNLDTTFRITSFHSYPIDGAPEVEGIHRRSRLRWVSRAGRLRLSSDGELAEQPAPALDWFGVWTGGEWISVFPATRRILKYRSPQLDFTNDCLAWFNVVDWPGVGGTDSLSETVQHAQLVELDEQPAALTCRLRIGRGKDTTLEVRASTSPRFKIDAVVVEFRSPSKDAPGSRVDMRVTWLAPEWRDYGRLWLPVRGERIGETFFEGETPLRGRVLFERESARVSEVSVDLERGLDLGEREGATVIDKTMRTSYRVGDTRALIDGAVIELREPIRADTVELLATKDADRLGYESVDDPEPERLTYRVSQWGWPIASALITFVVVLLVGPSVKRLRGIGSS